MFKRWHVVPYAVIGVLLLTPVAAACSEDRDDGPEVVTLDSYRAAVEATRACVSEKGFAAGEIYAASVAGMLTFSYNEGDGAQEAYNECYEAYLNKIEHDWFLANIPTGADRDALFKSLISCLEGIGVSGVTPALTREELVGEIVEQAGSDDAVLAEGLFCMDEHLALFPEGVYPVD